jgi:hypothetical protein
MVKCSGVSTIVIVPKSEFYWDRVSFGQNVTSICRWYVYMERKSVK